MFATNIFKSGRKSYSLKLLNCPISLGIVELNELWSIWKKVKALNSPILVEIVPVNWLSFKSNCCMALKSYNVSGRVPDISLKSISIISSRSSLPYSDGMGPEMVPCSRIRNRNDGSTDNSGTSLPESPSFSFQCQRWKTAVSDAVLFITNIANAQSRHSPKSSWSKHKSKFGVSAPQHATPPQ